MATRRSHPSDKHFLVLGAPLCRKTKSPSRAMDMFDVCIWEPLFLEQSGVHCNFGLLENDVGPFYQLSSCPNAPTGQNMSGLQTNKPTLNSLVHGGKKMHRCLSILFPHLQINIQASAYPIKLYVEFVYTWSWSFDRKNMDMSRGIVKFGIRFPHSFI